jgi:Protein of unknown function (DUF5672)
MSNRYNLFLELASKKPDQQVSVVIPIYKTQLSPAERSSLNRCLEVLINHPITIICPDNLAFDHLFFKNVQVKFEFFEKIHFSSVETYSRLMLSPEFYWRFLKYKYILIYQLDAFVFKDDLLDWCNQGYDYIGAPWLEEDYVQYWSQNFTFLRRVLKKLNIPFKSRVGNGGFSLRNVKKSLLILLLFSKQVAKWEYYEDIFWAYFVTSYFPFFKVADPLTAIRFSFETYPEKCYELNNKNLPFGCHAWEKYNINFWRNLLEQS